MKIRQNNRHTLFARAIPFALFLPTLVIQIAIPALARSLSDPVQLDTTPSLFLKPATSPSYFCADTIKNGAYINSDGSYTPALYCDSVTVTAY